MSPTIWPSATSNETLSSATMPPKRTVRSRTDRMGWSDTDICSRLYGQRRALSTPGAAVGLPLMIRRRLVTLGRTRPEHYAEPGGATHEENADVSPTVRECGHAWMPTHGSASREGDGAAPAAGHRHDPSRVVCDRPLGRERSRTRADASRRARGVRPRRPTESASAVDPGDRRQLLRHHRERRDLQRRHGVSADARRHSYGPVCVYGRDGWRRA